MPDIALSEKWATISEGTMLRVNEEGAKQTKSTSEWKSNVGYNTKVASNAMQQSASYLLSDNNCRGLTGQKAEVCFFGLSRKFQTWYFLSCNSEVMSYLIFFKVYRSFCSST